MSYGSASGVAAITQNLISGQRNYSSSTSPTLQSVDSWLSSGCSIIETALLSKSYSVPVAATARVYGQIAHLEELYGAAMAELSRTNVRLGPGERTRGQVFLEMFNDGLAALMKLDLDDAGLTLATQSDSTGVLYAGGISSADKSSVEDNTDRVEPRFTRGQFESAGVLWPGGTSGS